MKKIMSAALALAMTLSLLPASLAAGGGTAYASTQVVEVDGTPVEFQMYALKDANGNGTNYVKLRDVAHVLNGTKAQFSVGYDSASGTISAATGESYADTGTEMTTPFSGDRAYQPGSGSLVVDGTKVDMEAIVLVDDAGGGYTYFKLRDLGAALGFNVDWTAERGVIVATGGASETDPGQTTQPADPLELFQGAWKGGFTASDGRVISEELIITGDQFEMAQKVGSESSPRYFKGTVLVQKDMENSADGTVYPYVLTLTMTEKLNRSIGALERYDYVSYHYVRSIDPNTGTIDWSFGTFSRMDPADPASLYVAAKGVLEGAEARPDIGPIDPMNYAYIAMDYLHDHLKFPSTMEILRVKCGGRSSSKFYEGSDQLYVVTITYNAANSLGAIKTDSFVAMFDLTTGKSKFDLVGYADSLIKSAWGAAQYRAFNMKTEALGLAAGGTLSTELTREQIQTLVDQVTR